MKVVVTGSSGFVGQNLIALLTQQKYELQRLSMHNYNWKNQFDSNADAIIHLAGKAHDTKNASEESEYFRVNTELTRQVFDRFLQSEARDFIYFSSVKAVADSVEGALDEEVIPSPQTPYGQSKWQAEQYLNNQTHLAPGKRLFILRPCMIHGPGNKGNLNLLYRVVSKGIPWPLAAFENKRSFLSIDNLNFIIKLLLANTEIQGGTYNLADDDVLSTNELIKLIGEARGKGASLWKLPHGLISSVAKAGDILHLPLNTERLKKLTESYVVNNSKIKSMLKIEKFPIAAREGLLKTLRSF